MAHMLKNLNSSLTVFLLKYGREFLLKILKRNGISLPNAAPRDNYSRKNWNFIMENELFERYQSIDVKCEQLIYLYDTFVHATQTMPCCWQSDSKSGIAEAIRKVIITIIYISEKNGFISNTLKLWQLSKWTEDYHSDMDFKNF